MATHKQQPSSRRKMLLGKLVKKTLQMKIQEKRQVQGLEEIKVDFKSTPTYEMSEEELMKSEKRKQRNRRSAIMSREKRKIQEDYLEGEVKRLKNQKELQQKEILQLEEMERNLRKQFTKHLLTCGSFSRQKPSLPYVPEILSSPEPDLQTTPTFDLCDYASINPIPDFPFQSYTQR